MADQLIKKNPNSGYDKVMPKSWIEAIKDKNTNKSLEEILQGFNMYFLSYNGNIKQTRCQVPDILRKKGLWITYVKYDGNVYTEWYSADEIDDKSWGDSSNWRIGNNSLVGDITISANGNWVINGTETEFKAIGEKGNTPLLRVYDNKLQVSYDLGDTYSNVTNNPVYTVFRVHNNKLQASTDFGKSWTTQSDYIASWFRWSEDNRIQMSRTKVDGSWENMSPVFADNVFIRGYLTNIGDAPSNAPIGAIYMVGPDSSNQYDMYIKTSEGWVNNGSFTSVAPGIVQELGDSETEGMSQKAVTEEFNNIQRVFDGGNAFTKYGGSRNINGGDAFGNKI